MKYHPDEYDKRIEGARSGLLKRCRVFIRLLELNRVTQVFVESDRSDGLVKLLDAGWA
jgi:SERRATE/Ars2, N-terminal domain